VLDHARGRLREAPVRVHDGVPGRELRPAAQARPEAFALGGRRAREEAAMVAPRRARGAHRAAVDAGGGHADEEAAVEARIVAAQGLVALVRAEEHGTIIGPGP